MTDAAAPTADRTPLAPAVVLEAVQRIEAAGPLDDQAALQQAFRTRPTRAAQVAERGWLLGQRLGLPAELARWRHLGWWVVAALAVATITKAPLRTEPPAHLSDEAAALWRAITAAYPPGHF